MKRKFYTQGKRGMQVCVCNHGLNSLISFPWVWKGTENHRTAKTSERMSYPGWAHLAPCICGRPLGCSAFRLRLGSKNHGPGLCPPSPADFGKTKQELLRPSPGSFFSDSDITISRGWTKGTKKIMSKYQRCMLTVASFSTEILFSVAPKCELPHCSAHWQELCSFLRGMDSDKRGKNNVLLLYIELTWLSTMIKCLNPTSPENPAQGPSPPRSHPGFPDQKPPPVISLPMPPCFYSCPVS